MKLQGEMYAVCALMLMLNLDLRVDSERERERERCASVRRAQLMTITIQPFTNVAPAVPTCPSQPMFEEATKKPFL